MDFDFVYNRRIAALFSFPVQLLLLRFRVTDGGMRFLSGLCLCTARELFMSIRFYLTHTSFQLATKEKRQQKWIATLDRLHQLLFSALLINLLLASVFIK